MDGTYTVLLLRPDWEWDGVQADWVLREHVVAADPQHAVVVAIAAVIQKFYTPDGVEVEDDSFAPLAVYPGHIVDQYDPWKEKNEPHPN